MSLILLFYTLLHLIPAVVFVDVCSWSTVFVLDVIVFVVVVFLVVVLYLTMTNVINARSSKVRRGLTLTRLRPI